MNADLSGIIRGRGRGPKVNGPPHPPRKHVSLGSGRRQANPSTTRTTADDARLLPRHREPSPIVDRARLERAQAAALLDAMATDTSDAPLRYELTKPGDIAQLRGIPVLGAGAGAIRQTLPHIEGVERASRAEQLREKTA